MNIKLFYKIASILNAMDLTTSYIAFTFYGDVELTCLIAVVLYQLIITIMYYLAVRFRVMEKPFIIWSLIKVFAIAWNITQLI